MRKHHQGRGHPPALLFLALLTGALTLWPGPEALCAEPPAAPVAFRMDTLKANLRGKAVSGSGNVVVRQDLWLLCCDRFEAQSMPSGEWQHMRCLGRVRGYYGGRKLWANRADFAPSEHLLTLTGSPRISQGEGLLQGAKMTVQTDSHEVHIVGPKGTMAPAAVQTPQSPQLAPAPSFLQDALPDTCPWPWVAAPGGGDA